MPIMNAIDKSHQLVMECYGNPDKWEENLQLAEAGLREALEARPQDSELLTCLGAVLCDQGQFAEAQAVLSKAMQCGSLDRNTYFNLAVALLNTATHAKAKLMFGKSNTLVASKRTWQAYFDPMAH